MMFGYYGDHLSGWGWFGMVAGMLLFWGLVVTAIVLMVRAFAGSDTPRKAIASIQHTPEQVLAERFARGEIDKAEYQGRLAVLRGRVTS